MPRAPKAAPESRLDTEAEPLPDPSVWVFTHYDTLTYPEARDAARPAHRHGRAGRRPRPDGPA